MQQKDESHLVGRVGLQHFLNGDEILQRFAHFEPVDVEMPRVDEVIDPLRTVVVGLALGELVRVVRELEVHPPGVDVDREVHHRGGHRGALDVPAGPAGAPGRVPGRLVLLRLLPQGEVLRTPFIAQKLRQVALGLQQELLVLAVAGLQNAVQEPAVSLVLLDVEVHAAVGGVGEPVLNYFLDKLNNFGHVLGDPGHNIGQLHIQTPK